MKKVGKAAITYVKLIFNISIGPYSIPVYSAQLYDGHDQELYGLFMCTQKGPTIYLSRHLSGRFAVSTIWHEIFHAACYVYGHDGKKWDEERWVDFAACIIPQIERQNPVFVDWASHRYGEEGGVDGEGEEI